MQAMTQKDLMRVKGALTKAKQAALCLRGVSDKGLDSEGSGHYRHFQRMAVELLHQAASQLEQWESRIEHDRQQPRKIVHSS